MNTSKSAKISIPDFEYFGWIIPWSILISIWGKVNYKLMEYVSYRIYPFEPNLIPYTYWTKAIFQTVGPLVLLLPFFSSRITLLARRRFMGMFMLLTSCAFLFTVTYTHHVLFPDVRTYSIIENDPNTEIASRYDPQIRMEVTVTPGSEDDVWFQTIFLPPLLEKYGDSIHLIIHDYTNPEEKKNTFYQCANLGYFHDESIYLRISYAKLFVEAFYVRREDILQNCEAVIQACLNPIEKTNPRRLDESKE